MINKMSQQMRDNNQIKNDLKMLLRRLIDIIFSKQTHSLNVIILYITLSVMIRDLDLISKKKNTRNKQTNKTELINPQTDQCIKEIEMFCFNICL